MAMNVLSFKDFIECLLLSIMNAGIPAFRDSMILILEIVY